MFYNFNLTFNPFNLTFHNLNWTFTTFQLYITLIQLFETLISSCATLGTGQNLPGTGAGFLEYLSKMFSPQETSPLFFEKKVFAPFYSRKKSLRRPFFSKKVVARYEYPINFDPPLSHESSGEPPRYQDWNVPLDTKSRPSNISSRSLVNDAKIFGTLWLTHRNRAKWRWTMSCDAMAGNDEGYISIPYWLIVTRQTKRNC